MPAQSGTGTPADVADGETFTINDGVRAPLTFEFDTNGAVRPGNVRLNIAGLTSVAQVADRVVTVLQASGLALNRLLHLGTGLIYLDDTGTVTADTTSLTTQRLFKGNVSRPVLDANGEPAYGPGRRQAGVLGRGVHPIGVSDVARAVDTIRRERLDLEVSGVGGVATAADAGRYFEAGANAALMGSAPMFDPAIAARFKTAHPEW